MKVVIDVTTGRSQAKCRVCGVKIVKGNVRIGVPVFKPKGQGVDLHHPASAGLHWHHAVCCLQVRRAPDSRSKCHKVRVPCGLCDALLQCDAKLESGTLALGVRGASCKCLCH